MANEPSPSSSVAARLPTILTWALKIALALAFGAAALMKLTSQAKMVEEFDKIGFGPNFLYVTGAIELSSVLLLLWPRTAFFGALGLMGICAGAFVAQTGPLHGDVIHVFVLGALAVLAAWLTRPQFLR